MLHVFHHHFSKSQIEPCYGHKVQVPSPGTMSGESCVSTLEEAGTCVRTRTGHGCRWTNRSPELWWAKQTHPKASPGHRCFLPHGGHKDCGLHEHEKGYLASGLPQTTLQKLLYPEFAQWCSAVWSRSHHMAWGNNAACWWKPGGNPSLSLKSEE